MQAELAREDMFKNVDCLVFAVCVGVSIQHIYGNEWVFVMLVFGTLTYTVQAKPDAVG
jgi:hypothetical protein